MVSNNNIKIQLNIELEKAISEFKSSPNNEKLQIGFDKLFSIDFESYKVQLKEEIKRKLSSVWINIENGINPEQKLDAILFEHFTPDQFNLEALSYGIIDWQKKDLNHIDVDMGCDFDFADGLEQGDGITLDFFNSYLDYYETDEKCDLAHCYRLKGLIAIHESFSELHKEGIFDCLNKNEEFYFLVGEHDSFCYAVFSIQNELKTVPNTKVIAKALDWFFALFKTSS